MSWDAALIERIGAMRLHVRHGPIDALIDVGAGVELAEDELRRVFPDVLPELCGELDVLRKPVEAGRLVGPVARIAEAAALPFAERFVTPMAGIAGSVAEFIVARLEALPGVEHIRVNNGGDIALSLGQALRLGICEDVVAREIGAKIELKPDSGIGGIATSGWQGRSHSLGIADAVTVLARQASVADVAATLIANAADVSHTGIERVPAVELAPDSDLGERLVTVDVPKLGAPARRAALKSSVKMAELYLQCGLIEAAYVSVQGETAVVSRELVIA